MMPGPTLLLSIVLMIVCTVMDAVVGAEFIYNGFSGSNLHLDGEASITQDGVLTLTTGNSDYDIIGHGFHPKPVSLVQEHMRLPSFSTTFVFSVTPKNTRRYGYGMAFVISSTPDLFGASGDPFIEFVPAVPTFFAIELDTVTANYRRFLNIEDNRVGIDLNNQTPVITSPAGYRYNDADGLLNFEGLSLSSGKPVQVWVDCDSTTMELRVTLAPVPMDKPSTPLISYNVRLESVLVDFNFTRAYMGFSASTGDTGGASHQILGWSFNVGGPAQPLNYSLLPLKRPVEQIEDTNMKRLTKWLPATVSLLALLAGSAACLVLRRWCKKRAEGQEADWEAQLGPRRFPHKALRAATSGFGTTQLLGKGGFGSVYAGVLAASGLRIAVKRISSGSTQGLAQFTAEIIILGRLRHRNLVRLIGYCRHKDELHLVYEQMPNGSLDTYLYGHTKHSLNWSQRFRIIKGVASGLLYLHEDWEQVIIHRDVKASNVLLDGEMNGRLGDFGLARLHDHGADAHTTHVAGTRGYLAPELLKFGKATKATDVFAFGAFILEVACGRRPMGRNVRGELLVLVEWVRQVWVASGCVADAMDPRLVDYAAEEAELVLKLGLLCSHPLPGARPGMRLVMQYLDGDLPLPEFSPDYLAIITDAEQVVEMTPSVATTITSLSGGR
ncbi:unnamed protein product [Urochloa decumbens]|uniref:Protein kinase domain-containing protein n=2 Tax=Urochloa decumbens TaxID=240449 RepID=A0ABC9GZW1_9POAL